MPTRSTKPGQRKRPCLPGTPRPGSRKGIHMFARLCAAIAAAMVVGCAVPPTTLDSTHADDGSAARAVAFTTTAFTRPYIEVAPDGRHFYFDVLGEIYRASIEGGDAERLDLGDGWKWQPTLSENGNWLA